MPFDSEGNFTRKHNWEDDRINDIDIVTDHHDEEDDNFADALSQTFLRDGRVAMKGDFDAGNFKLKNLAKATVETDAVTKKQMEDADKIVADTAKDLTAALFKIGDIKTTLNGTEDDMWKRADGQELSRTEYADLFALISTNFGAGDGINTFNLPNYNGMFLRGVGGDAAKDIYTQQKEGLPNVTGRWGPASFQTITNYLPQGAFYYKETNGYAANDGQAATKPVVYIDASRSSAVYGASDHVTPVNYAVYYMVKVK